MGRVHPFIRVVVLAYDGADMTLECIDSVFRSNWPQDSLEVVLVDNGSIDDVVSRVHERFPAVRLIEPLRNLGFAGGCNAGIAATRCSSGRDLQPFEYVALVNNDAVVDPQWFAPLVEQMGRDQRIGAASPKMVFAPKFQEVEVSRLFPDEVMYDREPVCVSSVRIDGQRDDDRLTFDEGFGGPSEHSELTGEEFARWTMHGGRIRIEVDDASSSSTHRVALRVGARAPGWVRLRTDVGEYEVRVGLGTGVDANRSQIVECDVPAAGFDVINNVGSELYVGGSAGDRGFLERDRGQYDASADVFAWCGGAVLLRKEYLDAVGLFDESFFLYYEDTDLSWRGRLGGWKYAYVPSSVVRHRHAQSSVVGSDLFRFQVERNRLLVLTKNAPALVASRAIVGEVRSLFGTVVHDVLSPFVRLRVPSLVEVRRRWRALRSFASLLPHALRQRWVMKSRVSRRRVMSLAVDKVVPVPEFATPGTGSSTSDESVSGSGSAPRRPRAAVFNLYWDTLGGGEVVSGEIARLLATSHDVTLLGPVEPDFEVFRNRLGIDISSCTWREVNDDAQASEASADYDVFVNGTYSSRAVNRAPIGLYYVHFPRVLIPQVTKLALESGVRMARLASKSPLRTSKFVTAERLFQERLGDDAWVSSYTTYLANSQYTKKWIERIWHCPSQILHPPVRGVAGGVDNSEALTPKAHLICSLGRFFDPNLGHSKKQLEMLTAFADMARSRDGVDDWKLVFIGGADGASRDYVLRIRRAAQDLPIDVHVNASRDVVDDSLASASIYWHATGYGEDEQRHPERFEHFGISIVEAMAAGAVPIVFGEGGPAEIVRDGVDGFHWHTLEQLARITRRLMHDEALLHEMSESARARARDFETAVFDEKLLALVRSLSSPSQTM